MRKKKIPKDKINEKDEVVIARMKKMIQNEIISNKIKELNEKLFIQEEMGGSGEPKKMAAVDKFS